MAITPDATIAPSNATSPSISFYDVTIRPERPVAPTLQKMGHIPENLSEREVSAIEFCQREENHDQMMLYSSRMRLAIGVKARFSWVNWHYCKHPCQKFDIKLPQTQQKCQAIHLKTIFSYPVNHLQQQFQAYGPFSVGSGPWTMKHCI